MTPGPKILILDIETSKTIFGCYPNKKPQYLSHHDIIQDWFTICAAWRWKGAEKINNVSLLNDKKRFRDSPFDDYSVVKTIYELFGEADAVIGHNVDRFDFGKILERAICHRLPPQPKPIMMDTLKMARKANFSYNNLDYLCKRLGTSHQKREHGGNEMWLDIVMGRGKKRIEECVEYCMGDIPTAEDIFDIIAPYMPNNMLINNNLFRGDGVQCCRNCGSTDFKKSGFRYTSVSKIARCKCNECGKWFDDGRAVKRVVMR